MITEQVVQEALKIRAESPRTTFRQIAEKLLGNPDYAVALRKFITDQQRGSEVAIVTKERRRILTDASLMTKPIVTRLPGQYRMKLPYAAHADVESAMIISDLHCPHVDRAMIEAVIKDSKQSNITTLIIAGDVIDGQFTGRHKNPAQYTAPAEDELSYLRYYLKYFEHTFKKVYVCHGNHDEWVMNYFEVSFKEFLDMLLGEHKLVVSDYEYITVNDNIVIGHLEEWNEVPGYLAWKIANQFKRHAIVGHDHIRGVYTENNSKLHGISLGACLVPNNIYYKRASFNSFPAFQNGYGVLENPETLRLMAWDGKRAHLEKTIYLTKDVK